LIHLPWKEEEFGRFGGEGKRWGVWEKRERRENCFLQLGERKKIE
jgi:hypothetical protein